MLRTFDDVSSLILEGNLLHIAGPESLLKKLPKGNWIGGSIHSFMTSKGGIISNDLLYVDSFDDLDYKIMSYDVDSVKNVTKDAYDYGFSIIIMPFMSPVLKFYAEEAHDFRDMFMKHIVGWVSGFDEKNPTRAITINGQTGDIFTNHAVVLHLSLPEERNINVGIVNIFTPDENSPIIEFDQDGFQINKCLIDGEEAVLSEYMKQNNIEIKFPMIGDYSGNGINVSFALTNDGSLQVGTPVFRNIKYRFSKPIVDYEKEFNRHVSKFRGIKPIFSINCGLNFTYGKLEGKKINTFYGPCSFGEIAYQLMNQTLVYVIIT
ncbi:MAG: hypothetical protein LBR68_00185, partial [Lachnoclostridium sp.]|nr:hypothetical protein [Lachnoclostridium sp.]